MTKAATLPEPNISDLHDEKLKELRVKTSDLITRAILTLHSLPDKEAGWLNSTRSHMPEVVRLVSKGDYPEVKRIKRFEPTAQDHDIMLPALGWLTWLENQNDGKRDSKIIVARAFGTPYYMIAERVGRSDSWVQKVYYGAIATITARYWHEIDLAK